MPQKEAVLTTDAPAPLPFYSQAIKCQGMVYCSGAVGMDPKTMQLVEGGVADRAVGFLVSFLLPVFFFSSLLLSFLSFIAV